MPDIQHPTPSATPAHRTDTFDTHAAIGLASILTILLTLFMCFVWRRLRTQKLLQHQLTNNSSFHSRDDDVERGGGHGDAYGHQDSIITIQSMSTRRESMFRYTFEQEKEKENKLDRKTSIISKPRPALRNTSISKTISKTRNHSSSTPPSIKEKKTQTQTQTHPTPQETSSFTFSAWDFQHAEAEHQNRTHKQPPSPSPSPSPSPPHPISPSIHTPRGRTRRKKSHVPPVHTARVPSTAMDTDTNTIPAPFPSLPAPLLSKSNNEAGQETKNVDGGAA
ncbi:hypothetical protein B0J11DRAFT_584504 [Dendryphion nanum]|uniref:Uncharacterized protein n=1 Tax=Dendryphion nanum TaxID=256645 RepID=A0A9P9IBX6_9PLEO|nr:hypothetical protein B0J11DRAFT_584504 [Dendryphion nanum]